MEIVINVGLEHLIRSEHLGCGPQTRMIHADDLEAALPLIASRSPALVIMPGALEQQAEGGVVELVRRRAPRCRATLVVITLRHQEGELEVHEWQGECYNSRKTSIGCLRREAEDALTRYRETKQSIERMQGVGFNDCVDLAGRQFQVQTEVIWQDAVVIRSTVVEGGAALDTEETRPALAPNELGRIEQEALARHQAIVARVRRGQHS